MTSERTTRAKRPNVRVKQIRPHSAECWAKRKPGGNWWFGSYIVRHYLAADGSLRGSDQAWIELRCNCIGCDARAIVAECDVAELVRAALARGANKR